MTKQPQRQPDPDRKSSGAAHPGAIHIDRIRSTLKFKATDLRGGNGVTSDSYRCTAGFNTPGFNAKNSSGTIYTLTAGHCPSSDY
ncbi:hypothetical protein [Streptomyces sp. NPDC058695]|uniref:hypothetical protein n=1 Tax=Streptomyces sp. NPDC058695 TaxID=3346604 RepID=UPI00364D80A8